MKLTLTQQYLVSCHPEMFMREFCLVSGIREHSTPHPVSRGCNIVAPDGVSIATISADRVKTWLYHALLMPEKRHIKPLTVRNDFGTDFSWFVAFIFEDEVDK